MKRVFLLTALAGLAGAQAAQAGSWNGVVIAKDPAQRAVVTASASGQARTVRVRSLNGIQVGQRLSVNARALPDRTFRASRLTASGRASSVNFAAVVVRRSSADLLLSAGGTVVSVRSTARARTGDRVRVAAAVRNDRLAATSVQVTSHASDLQLEGIYLGRTTDGKLRVAVAKRGEVFVAVPATLTLPTLNPGDEVRLVVTVDAAGNFTLVSINAQAASEDENDNDDGDVDDGEHDNHDDGDQNDGDHGDHDD